MVVDYDVLVQQPQSFEDLDCLDRGELVGIIIYTNGPDFEDLEGDSDLVAIHDRRFNPNRNYEFIRPVNQENAKFLVYRVTSREAVVFEPERIALHRSKGIVTQEINETHPRFEEILETMNISGAYRGK